MYWMVPEKLSVATNNPADARLIAAAPEMAEFLQRLIDEPYPEETVWPWQQDAKTLLAKLRATT